MKWTELRGKKLAMLLMGKTAEGEDDWVVFSGTVHEEDDGVFLVGRQGRPFEIRPEWLDRIRPVPEEVKRILSGADIYLPLRVGLLPEHEPEEGTIPTGLRWPK